MSYLGCKRDAYGVHQAHITACTPLQRSFRYKRVYATNKDDCAVTV